jgi:hypothetical protein
VGVWKVGDREETTGEGGRDGIWADCFAPATDATGDDFYSHLAWYVYRFGFERRLIATQR